MYKETARMENWFITRLYGKYYLNGNVYNHPNSKQFDGKYVTTSYILAYNPNNIINTVETINTNYSLDKESLTNTINPINIDFNPTTEYIPLNLFLIDLNK